MESENIYSLVTDITNPDNRKAWYDDKAKTRKPLLQLNENGYLDFTKLIDNDWGDMFLLKKSSIYIASYDGIHIQKITLSHHFNLLDNHPYPYIYVNDDKIPAMIIYEIPKLFISQKLEDTTNNRIGYMKISETKYDDSYISYWHDTADNNIADYMYFTNLNTLDLHKITFSLLTDIVDNKINTERDSYILSNPFDSADNNLAEAFVINMLGLFTKSCHISKFTKRKKYKS